MPRPRKFQEADVVASASRVFAESGYAGTSIDDLIAATGLGRQSLYNAFGGKKELFMRAFLSDTEDAVAAVEVVRHGAASPLERIRTHLLQIAVTHGASQAQPSLFAKGTLELSAREPEVAESALRAFEEMEAHYRACLLDAQEAGEVQPDADLDALSTFFLATIEGMVTLGGSGVSRAKLATAGLTSLAAIPLTERGREVLSAATGEWA